MTFIMFINVQLYQDKFVDVYYEETTEGLMLCSWHKIRASVIDGHNVTLRTATADEQAMLKNTKKKKKNTSL